MLVGRGEECLRIDRLLDDARAGNGGALVVSGEPGIGKTSLLEHAAARAARHAHRAGARRRDRGVGAVRRPRRPAHAARRPCTATCPGARLRRSRSALAIGPTQPVDRLAVLVGAFNLLCAAAEERPVLALVDDAHWLDAASAEAIAFAARRIAADRVALLIATRSKGHADLPSVSPEPLDRRSSPRAARGAWARARRARERRPRRCREPARAARARTQRRTGGSSRAVRASRRPTPRMVERPARTVPRGAAPARDVPVGSRRRDPPRAGRRGAHR